MESVVINGNSIEELKKIPNSSVDLIVTSPPYGEARPKHYEDPKFDKYVEWFLPFSREMLRGLKPTGSFVLNIKEKVKDGERSTHVIELVLALKKQGWLWIEEYIWHKTSAFPGKWKYRFRDSWEHLYHFTKTLDFQMFQEAVMVPVSEGTKKRVSKMGENDWKRRDNVTQNGMATNTSNWKDRKMVYPSNVLYMTTESVNKGHPAVYPSVIPEWFIKLFTKEGDLVLDPFAGSGTTGKFV